MNVSERFLNYVQYGTQSDITSSTVPSTKGQLVLAARLADELKALGITDAHTDENGYVYGHIPAAKGCTGACLALIAHMDTAMDMSGDNINHASSAIMTEMTSFSMKRSTLSPLFPYSRI